MLKKDPQTTTSTRTDTFTSKSFMIKKSDKSKPSFSTEDKIKKTAEKLNKVQKRA